MSEEMMQMQIMIIETMLISLEARYEEAGGYVLNTDMQLEVKLLSAQMLALNEKKDKLEEKYKGTYRGNVLVLEGLHKDGSEFPIELVVSSFKTSEGTFFSGIIRDVSAIEDARIKQNGQ